MDELFGAPITSIAAVLAALFGLAVAFLLFIRLRNPILVRMAFRNVLRRPGQSLLILAGLMLATAIISSAFTIGDSVTYSIKKNAAASLLALDELLVVDEDSPVWEGGALPDGFSEGVFEELAPALDADADIDGVLPALTEDVAVINRASRQFEASSMLAGLDPRRAADLRRAFGHGRRAGRPGVAGSRRGLHHEGRRGGAAGGARQRARRGAGSGRADGRHGARRGGRVVRQCSSGTDVVLMASLSTVQEMLGRPGELSAVLVSNRGDVFGGVGLTDTVVERYRDHQAVGGNGLELVGIKRDVIDQANEIGGVFVSIFTTFGLFSIGVGLLLIFLIFSMLAAERKSEMGMARAVGHAAAPPGAHVHGRGRDIRHRVGGRGRGDRRRDSASFSWRSCRRSSAQSVEGFSFTPHVRPVSFFSAFLAGSVLTFVTVILSARRISRLNIVRAVRDLPEPQIEGSRRGPLLRAGAVTVLGVLVLVTAFQAAHLPFFGLGLSLIALGIAMVLRAARRAFAVGLHRRRAVPGRLLADPPRRPEVGEVGLHGGHVRVLPGRLLPRGGRGARNDQQRADRDRLS